MDSQSGEILIIAHASDAVEAQRRVRSLALSVGFAAGEAEELALVVSELASNILKYATRGTLGAAPLCDNGRRGLQIEAVDSGPGIANVEQALTDGFTTGNGLGYGLGVVNRMMDQVEIVAPVGRGTRVLCRRWLREAAAVGTPCPLALAAASRPCPGMEVNGDAFVIARGPDFALAGLIDGLGHGPYAHRAAETARHYVERHFDQALEDLFRGVARTCQATRGVVMALARFDWRRARMRFASIGNIEARMWGAPEGETFQLRRGILGGAAPAPVITEHPWPAGCVLVLHSDGLSTHWRWDDLPDVGRQAAADIARELLRRHAKDSDDATVLVVRDVVS